MNQIMTGGNAVIGSLIEAGVKTIFGIPGGHSMALYDALVDERRIRHVLGRHEQGLGFMADGYARSSGQVGVLTTTSGPAVANLACALGQATTDNSPVLAISSTVRTDLVGKNKGGLHDLGESLEIMRPVCRHVRRCLRVEEIAPTIHELLGLLKTSRAGGAYCEIPADILGATGNVDLTLPKDPEPLQADSAKLDKATELLNRAKRPLIWAGTGCVLSGAGEILVRLAEQLDAIVMTSTLGRGVVPSRANYFMLADGVLHTEVNDVVAEADVVLAVGTMFKQEDTADWQTKINGQLIHIDIDPEEINRSYPADLGIVADARSALEGLMDRMGKGNSTQSNWIDRAKVAESAHLTRRREQSPVEMQLLDILAKESGDDAILVCDRCNLGYWAYRTLPRQQARTFQYPMGYGGLGGALSQAIGAKLARPEVPVVCVIGDGGFQFTGPELAVAVQENIPIIIVLCNNGAYGAIRSVQDRFYDGRRFGIDLWNPDFTRLFDAYGIPACQADNPQAFQTAFKEALHANELRMIELTMDLIDP